MVAICCLCTGEDLYLISEQEIKQLFPNDRNLLDLQLSHTIKVAIAGDVNYIGCPTPGCKQYVYAQNSMRSKIDCRSCKASYCSICKEKYHYVISCGKNLQKTQACWIDWLRNGRSTYLKQTKQKELEGIARLENIKKNEKVIKDFQDRQQEFYANEQMLARTYRTCPNCGKPVDKIEPSCNAMTCGGDYHGGNLQGSALLNFKIVVKLVFHFLSTKTKKLYSILSNNT